MRFEDSTRVTVSGRTAAVSWYKNLGKVFVTLSLSKAKAKNEDEARKKAVKFSKQCGFPDWDNVKDAQVEISSMAPDLCIVVGVVDVGN